MKTKKVKINGEWLLQVWCETKDDAVKALTTFSNFLFKREVSNGESFYFFKTTINDNI